MNNLILVEKNTEFVDIYEKDGEKLVNARELWKNLECKTKFSDWINRRLENFELNVDYFAYPESKSYQLLKNESFSNNGFGIPPKDYLLTLDTAKEIGMMEGNDQGRKIRKYFIKIEKIWREQLQKLLPRTYKEALEQLIEEIEAKETLQLNSAIKAEDEMKCVSVAKILGIYTVKSQKPHSTFIGAILKQLDNTDNKLYRRTFHDIYNKDYENEVIWVKQIAIQEIKNYIDSIEWNVEPERIITIGVRNEEGDIIKHQEKRYNVKTCFIKKKKWTIINF